MRKLISSICALVIVSTAVSACGSTTTAPGIQAAPQQGATAAAVTNAPTTASATTTSSTATSPVALPAALKTKPVVSVPKGPAPKTLIVRDLIKGTGPPAAISSTVTVNYVGVLYANGKEFDSSWKRGTTAQFPLTGVIPGWQQGIPGMRVGGRRELIVPARLGYKNVAQPGIPANSALVFVIDLHAVS